MIPNLVRDKEIPGARKVGRNTFETLLFRALSTPIALLLVVIQSRYLEPEGRGRFVLVVLTVTILGAAARLSSGSRSRRMPMRQSRVPSSSAHWRWLLCLACSGWR